MSSLRILFVATLLGLCLTTPLSAAELPSISAVQRSLDSLPDRKLAEAEQKALQKTYEQTLSFLAQASASEQALSQLKTQLDDAPRQIREAQRELAKLKANPPKPISQQLKNSTAAQLELLLNDRADQLAAWQAALSDANSLIITAQTRPERAQAEISSSQIRLQVISGLLKNGKTNSSEQRDLLLAEQAALNALLVNAGANWPVTACCRISAPANVTC